MNDQLPYYLNGLTGISDKTLEMHCKLYEGYVKQTNRLNQRIQEFLADGKVDQSGLVFLDGSMAWPMLRSATDPDAPSPPLLKGRHATCYRALIQAVLAKRPAQGLILADVR
ncbi:MAG: hypothetical protein M3461_04775 [Pseudomonadota bacterium]|nr:hypothetical protein [Pseudomonadota bacterium]